MSKIDDGGSAFPHDHEDATGHPRFRQSQGMSLRDWFAGQAIGPVIRQCSADLAFQTADTVPEEYFAGKAYAIAGAMLAARSKGEA